LGGTLVADSYRDSALDLKMRSAYGGAVSMVQGIFNGSPSLTGTVCLTAAALGAATYGFKRAYPETFSRMSTNARESFWSWRDSQFPALFGGKDNEKKEKWIGTFASEPV